MDEYETWIRNRASQLGVTVKRRTSEIGLPELRIQYGDGFYFDVTLDPGILEVKTKPSTLEVLSQNEDRLQKDLFGGMKAIGLEGAPDRGGHVHIGLLSAFENAPLLLRNFIVDIANRPELAMGGMGDLDFYNALPLAKMHPTIRNKFAKAIDQFDKGNLSAMELLVRLDRVFESQPKPYSDFESKYVALNLYRTRDKDIPLSQKTVEMRAINGHTDASQFLKVVRLIEGRLNYLRTLQVPIALVVNNKLPTAKESAQRFRNYLKESGVDPDDYEYMIEPTWRPYFKERKAKCVDLWTRIKH